MRVSECVCVCVCVLAVSLALVLTCKLHIFTSAMWNYSLCVGHFMLQLKRLASRLLQCKFGGGALAEHAVL